MKFKRTILAIMLFALLTIGAVNASEDNATGDVLNMDDSQVDEEISVANDDAVTQSDVENNASGDALKSVGEVPLASESFTTCLDYDFSKIPSDVAKHVDGTWMCYAKAPAVTAKYKTSKYLAIKVIREDNVPVKNVIMTLKISTGKTYKNFYARTDSRGVALFNVNGLSVGTHNVHVFCENSRYEVYTNTKIVILKDALAKKKVNYKTAVIKLNPNSYYYTNKRLATGDILSAACTSRSGQHGRGTTIGTLIDAGQEGQHSTKLLKGKIYLRNDLTGKVVTKIVSASGKGYNLKVLPWIKGYTPFKAQVWYRHR